MIPCRSSIVAPEAPGSKKRRTGKITLEVLAAEKNDVESTNSVIIHSIVGSHSLRLPSIAAIGVLFSILGIDLELFLFRPGTMSLNHDNLQENHDRRFFCVLPDYGRPASLLEIVP